MRCCWAEDCHRPTSETTHSYLKSVREDYHTRELEEQSEFDNKWDRAKNGHVEPPNPIEQITLNSESVHVQILASEDKSSDDLCRESSKYRHIEPKIIVSNSTPKKRAMLGEKTQMHQARKLPTDASVIPMEPESANDLHVLFLQQKMQESSDKVSVVSLVDEESELSDKSKSGCVEEITRRALNEMEVEIKEDVNSNMTESASEENDTHIISKSKEDQRDIMRMGSPDSSSSTDDHHDDSIILSGSGNINDNYRLSATENISPLPSNTGTRSKTLFSVQVTSTPAPKSTSAWQQEVVTPDYQIPPSDQIKQDVNGPKIFAVEKVHEKGNEKKCKQGALHLENEMRTDNKSDDSAQEKCTSSEDSAVIDSSVQICSTEDLVSSVVNETAKGDDFYKDAVVDKGLNETEQENRGSKSDSESSVEEENEDRDSSEEEKLKILKMRLTDAFSIDRDENGIRGSKGSGDESTIKDELEIAREIYMSRGTTIPPTNHTTPRSLNTIPEDDIPLDNNLPTTYIPTNGNSVLNTPTKQALKFDDLSEEFSGPVSEPFEWDDYISDDLQLVGDVKYSESSPRQTMDFPEWSLDNDSSSQESESKVLNKAYGDSSASSTSESRPGSGASSLGTPCSTSESEVKSPAGIAARSYVKDLLAKRSSTSPSHFTYSNNRSITNKASFYALSHTIDLDSTEHAGSDSEYSTSPTSMTNGDGAFMDDWDL
ncbi:hypothetical protein FSP39_002964 [Pinctada imbricata]|uniref:Uncharacterized protein n=1 Tax=Pinctada imbricata TaxID=66713 RepID=A0AA89BVV0_PINIB|nr:hypothetical protein FSP39_002964 [Pinctada imbricata]